MINPIQIGNFLKKRYMMYINAGIPLAHQKYIEEREALYNEDDSTVIMQSPIIELTNKYKEEGRKNIAEICRENGISNEIAEFLNRGLLYIKDGEFKLYPHQEESFLSAYSKHRNIIVTTGTGSGKTECFMMPMLASIAKEAMTWQTRNSKKCAVRAMILYPLNALAEDQMVRLRKSLDSDRVKEWLKDNAGDKITFARYTGKTPKEKDGEEARSIRSAWTKYIQNQERDADDSIRFMMTNTSSNSAELYYRDAIKENPPDILITNYSMLNVMLMRKQESNIIEKTREWLTNPNNIFTLVVDELHAYRGTAGTEVAYIIKAFLDRIGLVNDDGSLKTSQIRFMASSASITEDEASKKFIKDFFGVGEEFKIISDPKPELVLAEDLPPFPDFSVFANINFSDVNNVENQINEILDNKSVIDYIQENGILQWLKFALEENGKIIPKSVTDISQKLDKSDRDIEILLTLLNLAKLPSGEYLQPIRAHYFARNIDSLWICCNPNCNAVDERFRFDGRRYGKMYSSPISRCSCGAKVFEVAVCRHCGEMFLGGYVTEESKTERKIRLGQKKIIGNLSSDLDYQLMWKPRSGINSADVWDHTNNWKSSRIDLDISSGSYSTNPSGSMYVFYKNNTNRYPEFPEKCPNCQKETKIKEGDARKMMPLFRHGTGVAKVNQVFADAVSEVLTEQHEKNKLILFTDSRQDAAKLSAGIELDHYRDLLRQSFEYVFSNDNAKNELLNYLDNRKEKPSIETRKLYGDLYDQIRDVHDGDDVDVEALRNEINKLTTKLDNVCFEKMRKMLVKEGVFPLGPFASDFEIYNKYLNWNDCGWLENSETQESITDTQKNDFYQKFKENLLKSIAGLRKTSLENLELGYLHCIQKVAGLDGEIVDSLIRYLAENYRIDGDNQSLPAGSAKFVQQATEDQKWTNQRIKDALSDAGIIENNSVRLRFNVMTFIPHGENDPKWICPRCGTHYLQPSACICIYCRSKLVRDDEQRDNYYVELAKNKKLRRLHCEELTGQTKKSDSLKRQRLFQNIVFDGEIAKRDEIDLISATTTMEAGVDIGSLSAVMMGNVPPQRFNYQQRVGRAGRRGTPLSIALTVAKVNSHDQTHYQQPNRMVMGNPASPYIKKDSEEIVRRIIVKECLYLAFDSLNDPNLQDQNDAVHGQFGKANEWCDKYRNLIACWLENHKDDIRRIISKYSSQAEYELDFISNHLISKIDEILTREEFIQEQLSERLAAGGLLPMFGFPTQTRNMYVDRLSLRSDDSNSCVFDRPLDLSLSTFVPGSEICRDKKVYTAIGFVGYDRQSVDLYNPRYCASTSGLVRKDIFHVLKCNRCNYTALVTSMLDCNVCPKCGSEHLGETSAIAAIPQGYQACKEYRNYDGQFEWQLRSSISQIDSPEKIELKEVEDTNLQIGCNKTLDDGIVNVINSNGGKFFALQHYAGSRDYPQGYYSKEWCRKVAQNPTIKLMEPTENFVLFSSKKTGVLELSIRNDNQDVCINPMDPQAVDCDSKFNLIRGAYLSWGMLVRKSIVEQMDIDFTELSVGFSMRRFGHSVTPIIYFTENNENGAGYVNYLANDCSKDLQKSIFVKSLLPEGSVFKYLTSEKHASNCDSSCYDCLRDYYNRNEHELLDWRIGLDLANIASANVVPNLKCEYWETLLRKVIGGLRNVNPQIHEFELTDTFALNDGEKWIIVVHPLWSKCKVNSLVNELRQNHKEGSCEFVMVNQFVDAGFDTKLIPLKASELTLGQIEINEVDEFQSIEFGQESMSISNASMKEIWNSLMEEAGFETEEKLAVELSRYVNVVKPDYDSRSIKLDGKEWENKYVWLSKGVILFYSYQEDSFNYLKKNLKGWKCFMLNENFNIDEFIHSIM
jgi:Lhr-like helicase